MLISAILPIMTLYHLPHSQYGYCGHVINLPQDVASFANGLPDLPIDLAVIVVRNKGAAQLHHDFCVRRSRVLSAVQWLQVNIYHGVTINPDALDLLTGDGDMSGPTSITLDFTIDSNQYHSCLKCVFKVKIETPGKYTKCINASCCLFQSLSSTNELHAATLILNHGDKQQEVAQRNSQR